MNDETKRAILETIATICLSDSVVDTLYNEIRSTGGASTCTLVEELVGLIYGDLTSKQQDTLDEYYGGATKEEWTNWINDVLGKK